MQSENNFSFIEDIINGMYDWVRVLDRDDNIIYINKAMAEGLKGFPIGRKCYEAIGRDEPCENCISRKAVFDGQPHEKEEVINGRTFSVMSSPVKKESGEIVAVVEVLRDVTHLKFLQNKILEHNRKLEEDLSLAKKLQCRLLPTKSPEENLKFSYIYQPCEKLGGDFLDIYKIDENHVGVYIADVSGHGISASMLTVFLRAALNKKTLSPSRALCDLYNEFNTSNFDPDAYITMFYAVIDVKNRLLTFSNAGHNVSPFVFNDDRFELLRSPGTPISDWVDDPGYTDRSVSLRQGDRIFLYTDGIVELRNDRGEQFGEERLLEILMNDTSEPSGTLNRIVEKACMFAHVENGLGVPDDITMALLEMK